MKLPVSISFLIQLNIPEQSLSLNDELFLYCTINHPVAARGDQFRDGKYIIANRINRGAYKNDWTSFGAAHIFPLGHGNYWQDGGFAQYITNMEGFKNELLSKRDSAPGPCFR